MPVKTGPWPGWDIWQYGDTNWSGGDSDAYNGTFQNFLATFAIDGTNPPSFYSDKQLADAPSSSSRPENP